MPGDTKPKLPPGLYWRGDIIWARFSVAGELYRRSCFTGSARVALDRRERERQAVIDEVRYGKSSPIGWPNAVLEWTRTPPPGLSPRTRVAYAGSLTMVAPYLDALDVQQIDAAVLRAIVTERLRHVTRSTAKNDLTAISSVLDVAIDRGWIEHNVAHAHDRRKLRQSPHKIILPTAEAVAACIAEAPGAIADMARLARATGMRQNELVELRRDQCAPERHALTIQFGAKRNKVRVLTLSADALAIIERQPRWLKSKLVFWHGDGEPYREMPSRWKVIADRAAQKAAQSGAGIHPPRFHDLRHLFAVEYLRDGCGSIYDLQGELGHDSIKTTEMYLAFLTQAEKRAAVTGIAQIPPQTQQFDTAETG